MENKLITELENLALRFSEKTEKEFKEKTERIEKSEKDKKKQIDERIEYNNSILADYHRIFELLKTSDEKLDVKIKASLDLIKQLEEIIRLRQSWNLKENSHLVNGLINLVNHVIDYKLWLERQKSLEPKISGFNDDENKIQTKFSRAKISILSYYLKEASVFRGNLSGLDLFSAFALLSGYSNNGLKNVDNEIKNQTLKITEQEKQELLDLLDNVKNKIQKEITPSKSKSK